MEVTYGALTAMLQSDGYSFLMVCTHDIESQIKYMQCNNFGWMRGDTAKYNLS